ncbi:hypothetical protein GGS21DRAFT_46713 [Xylaria nigripes]|nr:hypothetical protein GGS21DRAFT_46713 [Xylaria nigripes]
MSNMEDPNRSYETAENDIPTYNLPWPHIDAFTQGRFERKYLADGETIDFSTVPKPTFLGSLLGMTEAQRVQGTLTRVSMHSIGANRRLTGIEASAIAEHTAHSCSFMSWSWPVSVVISAVLAWRGRKTFRFPLYEPKMTKFDPYYFPSRRTQFWRGKKAITTWHLIRQAAYLPTVFLLVSFNFASMASSSFQTHAHRDQRLAGLFGEMRRKSPGLPTARIQQQRGGPEPVGSSRSPQSQPGDQAHQDLTSQGYDSDGYAGQQSSVYTNPSTAPEVPQTTRPSWGSWMSTQPAPQKMQNDTSPSSGSRHDDDSDLFDDDNSPVAPSARREAEAPSSSRSAWDRIREQAKSDSSTWTKGDSSGHEHGWGKLRQDRAPSPRDATPRTDSYTYSSVDEDKESRNYEKEKAQKEFDALVEAERRGDGGSGSSGSSSGRGRWK